VVLELAGGVRRAAKLFAHGFGGEAGDSESAAELLRRSALSKLSAEELASGLRH
jgi:hypothetical protein